MMKSSSPECLKRSRTHNILTLSTELSLPRKRYGVLGACRIGSGTALVLENPDETSSIAEKPSRWVTWRCWTGEPVKNEQEV
jgi:hypothetical protein